jgi:hypothetical protein
MRSTCGCFHGRSSHAWLALTALVFALPVALWPRGHPLRALVALLVATSVVYHGLSGHAWWARLVDMVVVRAVAVAALLFALAGLAGVLLVHLHPQCHQWPHGPLHLAPHAAMHCLGAGALLAL